MGLFELFSETPDILSGPMSSFSKLIPTLIIILLLIGVIYWLRSFQKRTNSTEIRVYRRP